MQGLKGLGSLLMDRPTSHFAHDAKTWFLLPVSRKANDPKRPLSKTLYAAAQLSQSGP